MNSNLVKIGSFLKRSKDAIEIKDSVTYKRITIKTKHQGIFLRDVQKGSLIGTKLQFKVKSGQFLLSKIDARFGAFGIVPNEVDGGVITGNFWTYDVDKMKVNIEWLNLFTSSLSFYDICDKASSGTTHRKYLDEKTFLNFEVKLPSIEEQNEFILWYNIYSNRHKALSSELDQQRIYLQFLRQAILQEAVKGKLTPQVETDEPATELLKRIKAEKQKLVKEGKLKKEKELPPIGEEEIPFELPKGWVWCKLGEIMNLISGVTLGKSYKGELIKVPYLRVANVQRGFIDTSSLKELLVPKSEIDKYNLEEGDLCMIEGGDWDKVGRCAIWRAEIKPCIHQNHIFRLRFYGDISNSWAEIFLNSPIMRRYFESCSKQTTNLASINQMQLKNALVALPPLAEQNSIVGKVQQSMEYIEQLDKQVFNSQTLAQQLMQAVLKEAFSGGRKEYSDTEELSFVAEA